MALIKKTWYTELALKNIKQDVSLSYNLAVAYHNNKQMDLAKEVFEEMWATGKQPDVVVEEKGLAQISDSSEIEAAVDQIIADNPAQVEKAKANPKLAGWFVGQVMKATGGKANPKAVNELVAKKLNS